MINDQTRIVAYSDLLGFSELAVQNPNTAEQLLSEFYNLAQTIKVENSYEELELFLFSDFLFVQGDSIEQVVNYMCQLYREAIIFSGENNIPMLIRGGVARGSVITQQRQQAPQVTKNFIVSPALTHAVKMESLVKGQRLLISAEEKEELMHFWNEKMHAICYDQPSLKPSKLFKKYRYQDLLWGRDLAKRPEESRQETKHLIQIALKLYRDNYKRSQGIVIHYAETLRICLLSYLSQLKPCEEDRSLISEIVEQTLILYPNPSVWMGFLELVLLSKDAFAFQTEPAMLKFLRHAILAEEWGEVSLGLAQPEHAQLKDAVQEFVEVAIQDISLE